MAKPTQDLLISVWETVLPTSWRLSISHPKNSLQLEFSLLIKTLLIAQHVFYCSGGVLPFFVLRLPWASKALFALSKWHTRARSSSLFNFEKAPNNVYKSSVCCQNEARHTQGRLGYCYGVCVACDTNMRVTVGVWTLFLICSGPQSVSPCCQSLSLSFYLFLAAPVEMDAQVLSSDSVNVQPQPFAKLCYWFIITWLQWSSSKFM